MAATLNLKQKILAKRCDGFCLYILLYMSRETSASEDKSDGGPRKVSCDAIAWNVIRCKISLVKVSIVAKTDILRVLPFYEEGQSGVRTF
jgi:hypothetical protein